MATPKMKKIKKHYNYNLNILRWDGEAVRVSDLLRKLNVAFATIAVDMERDGLPNVSPKMVEDNCHIVVYNDCEGSTTTMVECSAVIEQMETQKQADLREARAAKAKKSREENARKREERDREILKKLREKYGE